MTTKTTKTKILSAYQYYQKKKIKCTQQQPCLNCTKYNVECITSAKTK
ncbi:19903_t:CDS:1, partial [Racocetra persica]